jgi:hypothetical protein
MNVEFHYNITKLIAARAGFPSEDVEALATASFFICLNLWLIN